MISTYQRLQRRRAAGEIDGFTLIELLIVIVVLGILAAVVIFALGGITGKSALASCQADGATVSTALAAFEAQNPSVLTNVSGGGTTATTQTPPTTFGSSGYTMYSPIATGYSTTQSNTVGTIAIGTPVTTAAAPAVDTAMENALSSTTNYSGPYIQSWPSNPSHYGFVLGWVQTSQWVSGTPATWSAQLFVVTGDDYAPSSGGATYTTTSPLNGALTANYINIASPIGATPASIPALYAYSGPASCTNVS